jgi:hypothetical protein
LATLSEPTTGMVEINGIDIKRKKEIRKIIGYLPQEFIADNINVGFYYDTESDAVLYSDSEYMYTYKKGENVYTDDTGKTYNTDYSVVVESEGKCYVNWEYVAEHTDCEYE